MQRKGMSVLIVVETTIVGLVALGALGLVVDQYDRVKNTIAERTVVAQATEYFIAMLTATPPTSTPTSTPTRTNTPTPTSTFTPTPTLTPSISPTPSLSPTPTLSPTPRPPTLSPTPRPPTSVPFEGITQCTTIDESGNYRLG